ncbi:MAG: hypothetical protein Q8L13_23030 [Bradyrhizobium sp.]|uniref:hypothetical protein n=1 Tax=Bradyrhizobium sp. TaxID=376 RepID=UPI00273079BC|nr:hypothetical protein [Bradyrhizobium sp.]MDP1869199.1 hypothetical protein [Bradyrhizobium sp.]
MSEIDYKAIRRGLASLDASAAHAASGESRAKVEEIFAPEQHAGALDPNAIIVLGARGAGKSFWAGVLGNDETRKAASEAYPNLGLDKITVRFGFTGIASDGSISRQTIDAQIPQGQEALLASRLWRCVVLRSLTSALKPKSKPPLISDMMRKYSDPEVWENECELADRGLAKKGQKVLVIFDALDSIAMDWERLRALTDALLEVAWSTRGYRALRLKLFLRPDQMRDLGLRFVELPKLVAGATNLNWDGVDLYGMLFARLGAIEEPRTKKSFLDLLNAESVPPPPKTLKRLRSWSLSYRSAVQRRVFRSMAGSYMGRSHKKGRTYDWPIRHLADGHGEVTPRSFLTLMMEAARFSQVPPDQVISAEGIRHGLREASKVRVNQLDLEFPWIKRVLAPLSGLQVPCGASQIGERWNETGTIAAVMKRANNGEFLPPFNPRTEGTEDVKLRATLVRIGVLMLRSDDRFDMPDLFRVAARLLKKGGVAPS